MKQFKGTPGPWEVGDEFRIYGTNGLYLARQSMGLKCEICESNANLIAAAPELLEALECLIVFTNPSKTNAVALSRAYAAIAKALGDTK